MSVVSQPAFQASKPFHSFSAITNTCETRVRKRTREDAVVCGMKKASEGDQTGDQDSRRASKRPRLADDLGNASNNASCDESSRFVPRMEQDITESTSLGANLEETSHGQLETSNNIETEKDVAKIISLLLRAINGSAEGQHKEQKEQQENTTPVRPIPYRRLPTSPLSDSPHRVPFVRKSVGGSRQGYVDPGLTKWVLCKNLVDDVKAVHPAFRPPEWIEALHEMGWESYHPDYMAQCDDYIAGDRDFDDWVEVDVGTSQIYTSSEREQSPWKNEDEGIGEIFLR